MDIEKELRENPKAFEKIDYETYKEHVIVRNISYRPFSDEWKKSLMELTKEQLIEQLKNNIIENMQLKEMQTTKGGQVDLLVSLASDPKEAMQTADIEKQEQLLTLLYEFADKQLNKEGNKITHKGFREAEEKFRDIYSVGEYLKKIMNLFEYKITPVE